MSIAKNVCVIYGQDITELSKQHNLCDDKFLPYIEGHPDAYLSIIRTESGTYAGYVIASDTEEESFQPAENGNDLEFAIHEFKRLFGCDARFKMHLLTYYW